MSRILVAAAFVVICRKGWEIDPEGLAFFLRRMALDYAAGLPLYVTENGMTNADGVNADGHLRDRERTGYCEEHLAALAALLEDGLPLKGYFAWSLLDNYEWAIGYSERFGLVHVDYNSQQRPPKDSYLAWQDALMARRKQ